MYLSTKGTEQSKMTKVENKLPEHLQKIIDKKNEEYKKFGLDPEWHIKALKLAEARGDDNAMIHGLIG